MAMPITISSVGAIFAAQPLIVSASAITSAVVYIHGGQTEAKIWAKLSKLYTVPIPSNLGSAGVVTAPIIESLWTDLTLYGVLVKQAILANTLEESPWPDRYKEAEELLESIASGETPILSGSNTVIQQASGDGAAYVMGSSAQRGRAYRPTFVDGAPDEYNEPDPQKVQDIVDERG